MDEREQPSSEAMAADGQVRRESDGWIQRVGGFVELPGLLRELGADPAKVLASAGLEPDALERADNAVPYLAAMQMLYHAARHTGCAHLGLLAGQRWSLSHFGALGQLMRNSPTVGEALRSLAVFQRLNSDVGAAFLLEHQGTVSLGYTIYRENVPYAEHAYDVAMAVAYNLLRELCGPRWAPTEVVFARREPSDPTLYRQHFRAPVRFDREFSAVRFPVRWCQQPIEGADAQRCRELTERLAAHDSVELVAHLRRSLRLLLLYGKSSGDDLAQALSLHRRTLNRRLRAQGTTFQKVLDEVRLEVARQLLEQTRVPISDVSATLCYADVAAFMHAFKRWTGTTPGKWRASPGREPRVRAT
jgi:AraC-like DNA-binding protein